MKINNLKITKTIMIFIFFFCLIAITGCNNSHKDEVSNDNTTSSKIICKKANESQKVNGNVPNNNFDYGDAYLCDLNDTDKNHLFYVLDKDNDYVYLIDNSNIETGKYDEYSEKIATPWAKFSDYKENGGDIAIWNENLGSTTLGPITALKFLKEKTSDWNVSEVTLPTAEQLAKATGDTEWATCHNSRFVPKTSKWLTSNTDGSHNGFWTSTPYCLQGENDSTSLAWAFDWGGLKYDYVNDNLNNDVRAVIKVETKNIEQ